MDFFGTYVIMDLHMFHGENSLPKLAKNIMNNYPIFFGGAYKCIYTSIQFLSDLHFAIALTNYIIDKRNGERRKKKK